MENAIRKRLILGQVAIGVVIVLTAATAFVALGSTVQQAEHTLQIEQRVAALETLRAKTRELARSVRRCLLTGDSKERQRALDIRAEMQALRDRLRTTKRDDSGRVNTSSTQRDSLDYALDEYASTLVASMDGDRADRLATLTRFEDELTRVHGALSTIFDSTIGRERSQLDASRSAQRLARGARWALLFAAALGLALTTVSLLVMRRVLDRRGSRKRELDAMMERAMRSRRELLAASTELRAPLHEIAAQCARLRSEGKADISAVSAIDGCATRVARLLVDVIDVSGLQVGSVSLFRESCDAATLVERAIKHQEPSALERGIRVRANAPLAMAVSADRERTTHVLASLLGAAIASARVGAEIVVAAATTDDGVRFTVSDSAATTTPSGDLMRAHDDLSLHLCHRVIEAHGGRLGVEASTIGRVFWFTLPTEPSMLR